MPPMVSPASAPPGVSASTPAYQTMAATAKEATICTAGRNMADSTAAR